jgi:hypothetical protein
MKIDFLTDFQKILKRQISRVVQCGQTETMRDRQTDTTEQIVAFHDIVIEPSNWSC